MSDDTEFGYKATVRPSRPAPRPVYYVCENCGSDQVEQKWFCSWDVATQRWVPRDCADESDYCNDCGDCTEIEEREYGS